MPQDSRELRSDLSACLPNFYIEEVAQTSGQRVVYFGCFDDAKVPPDVPPESQFLRGWQSWGRVVVKIVAGASPDDLTRLQAEVALLAELNSTRFPKLLYSDYFPENPLTETPLGAPLFVSIEEFIESRPLSALMDQYKGQGGLVCNLAYQICEALKPLWLHRKRFVHRDIKPANILIRMDGSVVVIDLGIVRETGKQGITAMGWGKGPLTIDYAAPEQIANDKDAVGFRTDFFAIGVLMYQLLSGCHPFRTNKYMSDFEVATATETVSPRTLEEIGCANISISNMVDRLMQKYPHKRPRTVDELQDLLKNSAEF